MTWWQTLLVLSLLGAVAYLFGLFDKPKHVINAVSPGGAIIGAVTIYSVAALILYLTFAFLHKWIGPYIFGG